LCSLYLVLLVQTTSSTRTQNTPSHTSSWRVSYNKLCMRQQLQSQPTRRYVHQAIATIHTNIPTLLRCASLRILSLGFSAAHTRFYCIWVPNQKYICLCDCIFLHVYPSSFICGAYRQYLISLDNLKQWELVENYEYVSQPKLVTRIVLLCDTILWPEDGPQQLKHVISIINRIYNSVVFWRTHTLVICIKHNGDDTFQDYPTGLVFMKCDLINETNLLHTLFSQCILSVLFITSTCFGPLQVHHQ
jgi:hypothetical protein